MTTARRAPFARAVAWAALGLAAVLAWWPFSPARLVVVDGHVLRPWLPVLALLVVAGVAALVARRAPGPHPRSRALRVAVAFVGLSVALFGLAACTLRDLGTSYLVLSPTSESGCRVVVEETSFLMAGSGQIHLLPKRSLITRPAERYVADDGGTPFTNGSFELTWDGPTAVVQVWGRPGDPVMPGLLSGTC